jgi:hypothetical protein
MAAFRAADMDTPSLPAIAPEAWTQQFRAALAAQRERAYEVLAAQQARLAEIEAFLGQELHRLEERNAELERQLAASRTAAARVDRQPERSGHLDWEAEKRRILAALEADTEGDDQARRDERLRLEDVVRATDEAVAAKDRELRVLSERLVQQGRAAEAGASDTASVEQAMAKDAVLRDERQKLQRLQAQWQEKVRQAEVELALERAAIARQRAELEGRDPPAVEVVPEPPAPLPAAAGEPPATPSTRGRWLARLGLTDADREPSRRRSN